MGYCFANPALLERALTHRSHGSANYERLEFLGDSVLNFVIAEAVYHRFPKLAEGDLSRMRTALVRESTLAKVAAGLKLNDYVKLGEGELKSGAFRRESILADVLESVIGAIAIDRGIVAARDWVMRLFVPQIDALPDPAELKDPKTRLQEFLQGAGRALPEYRVTLESGPPHRRHISVQCRLDGAAELTKGEGSTRREAEQLAALRMLALCVPSSAKSRALPDA